MTEILTFRFDNLDFQAVEIDGQIWALGSDVCNALGLSNSRKAISRLKDDEKNTVTISDGIPGNPNRTIINETGIYRLIFTSRIEAAEKFRHWLAHEVLPSIRKSGAYRTSENSPQADTDNTISQKMFELQTWENELNHRWNRYNLAQNEKLAKQLAEQDMEGKTIVGSADILVRHSSLGDDEISDFITTLADSKKYPPEWVAWRRRLALEGRVKDADPSQMIQH
ncbi:BRO family protein [Thalassospira profundimaris]|uniref:BRO-N domain-containing protein n=1 Tax=Thalassospira profundimaris TaxID=502049 RepID=UPI000DED54D7|nr:BRO family protein [Thalassospira profundimaris]